MNAFAVWKRLLWKEFRQAWPVFAFAVLAPPLTYVLPQVVSRLAQYRDEMVSIATIAAPLTIVLWVVRDRRRRKHRWQNDSASLPVPSIVEWWVMLLIPATALALIGAWTGAWTGVIAHRGIIPQLMAAWAIFLPALFVVCCFITRVISCVAPVCSLFWMLWFGLSATPSLNVQWSLESLRPATFFNALALGIAIAFSFWIDVPLGGRRPKLGYLVALALMIAVPVGPYSGYITAAIRYTLPSLHYSRLDTVISPDGSFILDMATIQASSDEVGASFHNSRTGRDSTHVFKQQARVLGVVNHRRTYIAQQLPGDTTIRILVWDVETGGVSRVVSFAPGKDSLDDRGATDVAYLMVTGHGYSMLVNFPLSPWGHVSPSGDYLVLRTRSTGGIGDDLWLVDLRNRKSAIVLANAFFAIDQASWTRQSVVLSGVGDPTIIDLKTMEGRIFPLAAKRRAKEGRH
jgi:hypothetical protein